MAKWLALLVALGLLCLSILLIKTLDRLPLSELRRRARSGNSKGIYQLKSYGSRGRFALIFIAILSFVWLIHEELTSLWEILIAVILLAVVAASWTGPKSSDRIWALGDKTALYLSKLLSWLPISTHQVEETSSKIYEKADLIEMLEHQLKDKENRISPAELKTAISVLNLTGKKISNSMIPLNKAKLVPENDQIGPHLLNELHKFSTDCFIVVKDAKASKPEIVGTLYLADAAAMTGGGSVKSAMKAGVEFIDEDLSLIQALEEFLNRKAHVLAVRNGFDELVGVLSLQSALESVLGAKHLNSRPQISVDGDKLTTDLSRTNSKRERVGKHE